MTGETAASVAAGEQTCEGPCRRTLPDGEPVYGTVRSTWGADPFGIDALTGVSSDFDMSSGYIADTWRCADCFQHDSEVQS